MLSSIYASCDTASIGDGEAPLGIDAAALEEWLQYVQPDTRPLEDQKLCDQLDAQRRCTLLQAADVLRDERTEAAACAALAAELEAECDSVLERHQQQHPAAAVQVLTTLSEDLALKVLRATHRPFSTLLRYLAATPFRPLLIHACHPSIDAHASLHLDPVPAADAPLLLSPIASFTRLQSLSLAGIPLKGTNSGAAESTLETVLCALPALSALCLRDTALRSATPALAAALPTLKHLRALDASGNRLDGAFAALAAALPAALALRTLLLDGAVSTAPDLGALAGTLWKMPQLEQLSLGSPCHLPARCKFLDEASDTEHPSTGGVACDLLEVMAPLRSMHALHALELRFSFGVLGYDSSAPLAVVASLTQLRHLRVDSLDLCNIAVFDAATVAAARSGDPDPGSSAWRGAATPGSGLSSLQALTSLDLSHASTCQRQLPGNMEMLLGSVLQVTALQRLQLPRDVGTPDACRVILKVARGLSQLTQIAMSEQTFALPLQGCLRDLAIGLARIQHLREIHVLVMMTCCRDDELSGALEEAEVAVLRELVRAAADKTVEIELRCYVDVELHHEAPVAEGPEELVRSVLPLCRTLLCVGMRSPPVRVICAHSQSLAALKNLHITVDGPGMHGRAEREGDGRFELVRRLGQMTGLQSLGFHVHTSGNSSTLAAFCEQLRSLRGLTRVHFGVMKADRKCVPQVIDSCRSLPSLRRLELRLLESSTSRLCAAGEYQAKAALSRREAGRPQGWDVGALLSLRTLLVSGDDKLERDETFWGGVVRLPCLQCLYLNYRVDARRLDMLAARRPHLAACCPLICPTD